VPSADFLNISAIPLGALCVGAISILITFVGPRPRTPKLRFWYIVSFPLSLAILLNFLPIWSKGSYPSCGWDVISIILWATPGGIASMLLLDYRERKLKAKGKVDT
jgi:hypothetical protein